MKFFLKKKYLPWLWVALCTLSIFLVVPLARSVRDYLGQRLGADFFGYFVICTVCIAFFVGFYFLWFRLKIRTFSNYIWLVTTACVYIFFTLKLWKRPEEAVHFLEYGLLGLLLFRALRSHIDDKSIYLMAILIGVCLR
jgi:hypothetical protein